MERGSEHNIIMEEKNEESYCTRFLITKTLENLLTVGDAMIIATDIDNTDDFVILLMAFMVAIVVIATAKSY